MKTLIFLISLPLYAQYTHSAAVNLPTYAQGLTNFPYLISCNSTVQSCPQFKTVANGGQVQNSSGFDIAFYADSGCSITKLNWETEDWSASTGNGDWWVQVPASTNTFYECWDNAAISTDQSNKTGTWSTENYQFVMHGGTPSSFSTSDSSANAIAGTAANVTAGTGIVNGAGSYNGTSSDVDYGIPASTQCTTTCTIEAWIKTATNSSDQQFVSNQWSFCCDGITVQQTSTFQVAAVNVSLVWGKSGSDDSGTAIFNVSNGVWHLVVFTFNAGVVNIYVDGILANSRVSTLTSITYGGSKHLIVGRDSNGSDDWFNGLIDEVRISSDAKTGAWVQAEYQNVFNAVMTTQPVRAQPYYLLSSYDGASSVVSSGMTIATSLDGVHWNSVYNTSESGMLVPVVMQWNGSLWRVHQVAAPGTCAGSGPEYIVDKTALPLAPSSTFSSVATVCINASVGTSWEGESWFIGDDGIPNILFSAGSGTSTQTLYLVTPTDTTGLTAWNTTATALIAGATNYIDPDLVEISPTSYVLFGKDATAENIVYWTSSSKLGTYTLINADLFTGPEAPSVVQTGPTSYTLYMDNPGSNLKFSTISSGFPGGSWSAPTTYFISGCANGPTGYCFHPHMIPIAGQSGVR